MAGAPKGNKNALKGMVAKTTSYRLTLTEENKQLLDKIAIKEGTSIAQILEKALLNSYPEIFTGKF